MKLSEIKAIAAARTKCPWHWDGDAIAGYEPYTDGSKGPGIGVDIIKTDSGFYPPRDNDADFIIMAANTFDKLLAVVEAASHIGCHKMSTMGACTIHGFKSLQDAFNALESE